MEPSSLSNILLGILPALLYATIFYAINKLQDKEMEFNSKMFGKTILIGFILNLLAMSVEIDVSTVEATSVGTLLTVLLDKIVNKFM